MEWGIEFENGTPVFDYYKDAAYLHEHPREDIGFITWSNGKNDGGIGWPQAVEFYRAMQETRRPHIFVWGLSGHGQRASMPADGGQRVMPIDIRTDQSLPAFTRCSLDGNPGKAVKLDSPKEVIVERDQRLYPYDGDPTGQVNLYLLWETSTIVDTPDRWEITVTLRDDAPESRCLVDITARRLQEFEPNPGRRLKWTNTCEGALLQSGEITVDKFGLATLPQVIIDKAGNRIILTK